MYHNQLMIDEIWSVSSGISGQKSEIRSKKGKKRGPRVGFRRLVETVFFFKSIED